MNRQVNFWSMIENINVCCVALTVSVSAPSSSVNTNAAPASLHLPHPSSLYATLPPPFLLILLHIYVLAPPLPPCPRSVNTNRHYST